MKLLTFSLNDYDYQKSKEEHNNYYIKDVHQRT